MFTRVAALMCLVAVASARPDKRPSSGYGYSAPSRPISYAPPPPPTPSYSPPQPSYEAPRPSYSAPAPSYESKEEGMPFDFEYAVKDEYKGVDFDHDSNSDGKVVTGEYSVLLPDGRTQIVRYTADHYNGYQAEVIYEGEAQYPEPKPYKPQPSYSAPTQSYQAPTPSYSAPSSTYEQPDSLYGPPRH